MSPVLYLSGRLFVLTENLSSSLLFAFRTHSATWRWHSRYIWEPLRLGIFFRSNPGDGRQQPRLVLKEPGNRLYENHECTPFPRTDNRGPVVDQRPSSNIIHIWEMRFNRGLIDSMNELPAKEVSFHLREVSDFPIFSHLAFSLTCQIAFKFRCINICNLPSLPRSITKKHGFRNCFHLQWMILSSVFYEYFIYRDEINLWMCAFKIHINNKTDK